MIEGIDLGILERCFGGSIPAVICTVSADGTPNVTYLSAAHRVDDERIALSNQFMSKTARNLAADPRASLLLLDPVTFNGYRLSIVFERTERRGPVFDRLKSDVENIAAFTGMGDVFRLRAADVFRVTGMRRVNHPNWPEPEPSPTNTMVVLAELLSRIGQADSLDTLLDTALDGIVELLGYRHVNLMLLDESERTLYTIASRGFDEESIGAEVAVGEGIIGAAAVRRSAVRMGNVVQMSRYSRAIQREYVRVDGVRPGREIPMPGLERTGSRLAVPAVALGRLVGVLSVDHPDPVAFSEADEQSLGIVASALAGAIEHARALASDEEPVARPTTPAVVPPEESPATSVRHFAVDGSTFLGGDYLVKGVAGRILWSLVSTYDADGRVDFTNRELRLDRSLELPEFKDNLESRLVLLKRRLDEREASIRIERTGRGRFRLRVGTPLLLEAEVT